MFIIDDSVRSHPADYTASCRQGKKSLIKNGVKKRNIQDRPEEKYLVGRIRNGMRVRLISESGRDSRMKAGWQDEGTSRMKPRRQDGRMRLRLISASGESRRKFQVGGWVAVESGWKIERWVAGTSKRG